MPRKLSLGTTAVLHSLARGHRYGFDIMEATGLTSGTIYPALERLETDGLAESDWEDPRIARQEKRPPRRYFEITEHGRQRLQEVVRQHAFLAPVEDSGAARSER